MNILRYFYIQCKIFLVVTIEYNSHMSCMQLKISEIDEIDKGTQDPDSSRGSENNY